MLCGIETNDLFVECYDIGDARVCASPYRMVFRLEVLTNRSVKFGVCPSVSAVLTYNRAGSRRAAMNRARVRSCDA